jgi:DNA polymerase-3 subunit beta
MKCICDRQALNEALAATSSVILSRTPKPILQCVRITAEKKGLTLTAYDQEVGLRYRISQVEVSTPGETLVMGDRLMAIVRESADETLAFESDQDILHIKGADSHFKINGQSIREYPPVPDMEGEASFTVKVNDLKDAIGKTLFAAARENTRYAINGVLWEKAAKRLQLVATDGRRLALTSVSLEKSVGEDRSAIVPTKALALLSKLHFGADDVVEVQLSPNQIIFKSPHATISSVLVEGHFPKYQDVIPKEQDKKINLKTADFLSAVRRASLLANMESKGIRLKVAPETMVLSSRTPEQGEATVRLRIDYSGAEMEIGFNPEFIIEALKVCDEQTVLELKEPTRPGILRSGPNFQYVVMPVNLS